LTLENEALYDGRAQRARLQLAGAAEKRCIVAAKAFYQSVQYERLRDRKVRRRPLPDAVTFSSA
jgi:hypothetical protein